MILGLIIPLIFNILLWLFIIYVCVYRRKRIKNVKLTTEDMIWFWMIMSATICGHVLAYIFRIIGVW